MIVDKPAEDGPPGGGMPPGGMGGMGGMPGMM